MKMSIRKTAVTVIPNGEPIFSEAGYVVEIRDNAAGEYLAITANDSGQTIEVDFEHWDGLRDAVEEMAMQIVRHTKQKTNVSENTHW